MPLEFRLDRLHRNGDEAVRDFRGSPSGPMGCRGLSTITTKKTRLGQQWPRIAAALRFTPWVMRYHWFGLASLIGHPGIHERDVGKSEDTMNEAVMSGEPGQPEPLRRVERLQLTWALAWPCALLGLVYFLLRGQLRLSEAQLHNIDQVFGILQFFLFTTWVVRRTVRLDFPGFHLLVVRGDAGEGTRTMSYCESLSVAWLISWRSSMFLLPLYVAVTVLRQQPQELYRPLGWLSTSVAELLIFYVWIVKAALGKSYSRFSLRLDRSALKNA
jgi:hypothetical protein